MGQSRSQSSPPVASTFLKRQFTDLDRLEGRESLDFHEDLVDKGGNCASMVASFWYAEVIQAAIVVIERRAFIRVLIHYQPAHRFTASIPLTCVSALADQPSSYSHALYPFL